MKLGILTALLVGAFLLPAEGQAYHDIVFNRLGQPMAGANVAVCSSNPGSATPPCTSTLVQTYTTQTGSVGCTLSAATASDTSGSGCTMPGLTDAYGNYTLYIPTSGMYWVQVYGPTITTSVFPIVVPTTASNFVDLVSNQSVAGNKTFTNLQGVRNTDGFGTIQLAIADLTAHGASLYLPASGHSISSALNTNGSSADFSNTTFFGAGPFASALTLANGSNSSMFLSGTGAKSRFGMIGWAFNGNKANQSGTSPCVSIGETAVNETDDFDRNSAYQCAGDGFYFGGSGVNRVNLSRSAFISNGGSGIRSDLGAQDFFISGNLSNFNSRYGIEWNNINRTPEKQNLSIFGNHLETNTLGAFFFDWTSGATLLGNYILDTGQGYFGQQSRKNKFMFNRTYGTLADAGFYNVSQYNNCETFITQDSKGGACANRDKFPLKEDHMDLSIVADADMSAANTTSWTAGANATIAKTAWNSATTGNQYLKLTCTASPCEATQDITDSISASAWFRMLYTTSDVSGAAVSIASVQLRRSDTDAVLVDSGTLPSFGDTFSRPDFAWETTAKLPGGNWRVALRCNSTTIACFFTDIRLIKNYVANPNFEVDLTSWTTTSGSCATDAVIFHTGIQSVHCTSSSATLNFNQTPSLTAGEYYLVRAWLYTAAGNTATFAYGVASAGTQVNNFYSSIRNNFKPPETGVWRLVEWVERADSSRAISLGSFATTSDIYMDDVAIIHLNQAKQIPYVVPSLQGPIGGVTPNAGAFTTVTAATTNNTTSEQWNGQPVFVYVTGDFTTAANTNLQAITGLTWTMPGSLAINIPFDCYFQYSQATAAVSDSFGIQDVTTAPTQINANGTMQTNTTVFSSGPGVVALASTTGTAVMTATPSAITTVWSAEMHGVIEQPSGTASAINIMVKTTNGADLVTVKRGSYCRVGPK